jgi:hypothetical protein
MPFKQLQSRCAAVLVAMLLHPLTNAWAITTADVLPKGVRVGAFIYGRSANIDSSFNSSGDVEFLARPINRSIPLSDLVSAEPQLEDLRVALNAMGPDKLGDQLLQLDLYQDIGVSEARAVPALLWGISDRLTLGIIVPVVHRVTTANFSVKSINNAGGIQDIIGKVPQIYEGLDKVKNAPLDADTIGAAIFQKNGFITPSSFEVTSLGDIELEARYRYYLSSPFKLALRAGVRMPTASHVVDIRNVLDRPTGQGNVSFRVGSFHDYLLVQKLGPVSLSFNTAAGLNVHLPASQLMAVRKTPDQILPDLNDPTQVETVRRWKGADTSVSAGLMADFWGGAVSLSATYLYEIHAKDRYWGANNNDYAGLEANTFNTLHSLDFGIELSSLPLYLNKQAMIPAKICFDWVQPVGGVNGIYAPYGRVDFVIFF